jgi:sugar lactone lactonase YvrE
MSGITGATGVRTLAEGFAFLECPRWHDGLLWVSDMHRDQVVAINLAGEVEKLIEIPGRPGGLGWLPDGSLLVVATLDRKILRLDGDALTVHSDLTSIGVTDHELNDMTVDALGRCFVGEFGVDVHEWSALNMPRVEHEGLDVLGEVPLPEAAVFIVEPDGTPRVAAGGLRFPNGSAVSAALDRYVVAESFGLRLSEYDIANGALSSRRIHDLGFVPDGISQMDAEGAVWVSDPFYKAARRVDPSGRITDSVQFDSIVYACELGGAEGRTLFACLASSANPAETIHLLDSHIAIAKVDVPIG